MSDIVAAIVQFVLAAFFLLSGASKVLSGPTATRSGVAAYQLLPPRLVTIVATLLPWIEIALAVLLVAGAATGFVALSMAGLLLLFTGAVSSSLARGMVHGCGCLPAVADRPVGWGLIGQNLVLAAGAVWVAAVADRSLLVALQALGDDVLPAAIIGSLILLGLLLWAQADATGHAYGLWRSEQVEPMADWRPVRKGGT